MSRINKGQAAVEFYTFLAMFMLVLAVVMTIFLSIAGNESQRYDSYSVDETAARFADIIHASYVAGNGFNGTFDVPTDVAGAQYDVTFKNAHVIVVSHGYDRDLVSSMPLVTSDVKDDAGSDTFTYNSTTMGGDIQVININGSITVRP